MHRIMATSKWFQAVRYFIPTENLRVKLIEFTSEIGETSEIIYSLIVKMNGKLFSLQSFLVDRTARVSRLGNSSEISQRNGGTIEMLLSGKYYIDF